MADWTIEPLDRRHERAAFACGRAPLDDFLRARVTQYEQRRLGRTFVALPAGGMRVVGYATLAAGAVAFGHLPPASSRKLPRHPLPVVLLARLAVDRDFQGKGIGEMLLLDALERSLALSEQLGIFAVEVLAIDETAAGFYRRYGCAPLVDDGRHLFLPMETVRRVLG